MAWYPLNKKQKEKQKDPEFLKDRVYRKCTKCGDTFMTFRAKPAPGYEWLCPYCWAIESAKKSDAID